MMNKTIPVFDEAGNYNKDVFPRYAIQRVLRAVSYTHLTLPTIA